MTTSDRLPFELAVPGGWVQLEGETCVEATRILQSAIMAFEEAVSGVLLFEQSLPLPHVTQSLEEWHRDIDRRDELQDQVKSKYPDAPRDRVQEDALRLEVDRLWLRDRYAQGVLPPSLQSRRLMLVGKGFLFAVNDVGAHLSTLGPDKRLPNKVRSASNAFYKLFPHLVAMRDTGAHPEDRLRFLNQKGERIPGPGHVVYASFVDSSLVMTTASGLHASIEISWKTIATIRDHLEGVFNELTWDGGPSIHP